MQKSVFTSKTMWANVMALIAAVSALFGLEMTPEAQMQLVEFLLLGMPMLNVVLRFVTKDKVVLIKE